MSRGRPRLEENIEQPKQWSRLITGEDCDTTWYYDTSITTTGPVRVDVKWHKTQKQMENELKAEKAVKKTQRDNNKFFKVKEKQNESRSSSNSTRGRRKTSS